ncbi:hypothetical protein P691DRAFT_725890 [Macrolepiota fuliginosa MF-IS2]|uniref:Fe2OG dioxygenase domain-containing protein n=1 Tax=Macrolepiota fuliginosa MF-IS2 TaxID=1400762 RepID=A0A9P5XHQ0_9AGAR|nr:hypothetical protein P691DRAFT_725890 [Macrolepiota fuliginosa MF-IS2]
MEHNLKFEINRIGNYDAFYFPNFLSRDEEQYILRKIHESPRQKWKQLANRRLQIWEGGEITKKGLLPQSLPSYLTVYPNLVERLRVTGAFANSLHQEPNHVILNEYHPGQGIMPHEDGPKYFPAVATISLGSHAAFNYYRYKPNHLEPGDVQDKVIDQDPVLSVLLEPRSLIVSLGDMYTSYLHGIDPVKEDRILPFIPSTGLQPSESQELVTPPFGVFIGNWDLLGDEDTKRITMSGGILQRGTRYSLTCRDVERVLPARSFGFI